jgi:hypothetical protein
MPCRPFANVFVPIVVSLLCLTLGGECEAQQRASQEKAVASVKSIVSHEDTQEFAICHIRPAFWGGYDVTVRVSGKRTVDDHGRVFKVSSGSFSETPGDATFSGNAKASRTGTVQLRSAEEAFAKGVPFFITDFKYEAPDKVHFTVLSNPDTPVEEARWRHQSLKPSTGEGGYRATFEIVGKEPVITSSSEPQQVTITVRNFTAERYKDAYISIIMYAAGDNRCLVSNEVSLGAIAAAYEKSPQE